MRSHHAVLMRKWNLQFVDVDQIIREFQFNRRTDVFFVVNMETKDTPIDNFQSFSELNKRSHGISLDLAHPTSKMTICGKEYQPLSEGVVTHSRKIYGIIRNAGRIMFMRYTVSLILHTFKM